MSGSRLGRWWGEARWWHDGEALVEGLLEMCLG